MCIHCNITGVWKYSDSSQVLTLLIKGWVNKSFDGESKLASSCYHIVTSNLVIPNIAKIKKNNYWNISVPLFYIHRRVKYVSKRINACIVWSSGMLSVTQNWVSKNVVKYVKVEKTRKFRYINGAFYDGHLPDVVTNTLTNTSAV